MVPELVAGIGMLIIIVVILFWRNLRLRSALQSLAFDKKSQSVRYGKMSEQFFPFLANYPHDPQNFRFMGTPVDGIQFEKDKIVFVEFKTGSSRLSPKQKDIKDLVKKKKVAFEEVRLDEDPGHSA